MSRLQGFVAKALAAQGALVESPQLGELEVVVPESVQHKLSIPELVRLGFGSSPPDGTLQVTLESDWVEQLGALLEDRGAQSALTWGGDPGRHPSSPERSPCLPAISNTVLRDSQQLCKSFCLASRLLTVG